MPVTKQDKSGAIPFGAHVVYPKSFDEAKRWIDSLRDAYNIERAYTKRLEADLHRQRNLVEYMLYWVRARGMHKAPWLERAKLEAKELVRKLDGEPLP